MTDEQREKIADLFMADTKKAAMESARPTIQKLRDSGVDMTPEREEIIIKAFISILIAALAASMIMRDHPGMTPEELDRQLKEMSRKEAEGEL